MSAFKKIIRLSISKGVKPAVRMLLNVCLCYIDILGVVPPQRVVGCSGMIYYYCCYIIYVLVSTKIHFKIVY